LDDAATQVLEPLRHTFSHYHLDITPARVALKDPTNSVMEGPPALWYNVDHPANIGLAAPVKRLLERYAS
jgi:A/G-specific adenine glycosylase